MKLTWDFQELFDFGDQLKSFGSAFNPHLQNAAKEIAEKLHKMLIQNTPVDFGTLQAFWQTEENYSYVVEGKRNGYEVTLYNRAVYATWVNDGHKQRPGRFIPGYWEGRHFRYDPTCSGGMVLKNSWVKGRFFVEISITQLESSTQVENIVYKHLQKWWKECFKG